MNQITPAVACGTKHKGLICVQVTQQPGDIVTQQADDTETIAHSGHHLTHEFSRSGLRTARGFVGFENKTVLERDGEGAVCEAG